jgi:LmbE family N-acetylglucosaminyl deacetylase
MRRGALIGSGVAVVGLLAFVLRGVAPAPRQTTALAAPRPSAARPDGTTVAPLVLPPHPRVIVFSPHPDDETIGIGGLIFRLVHAHVPLRVVFMTNGDGFSRAVETDFEVRRPTDADYLTFGELRRREAVAALGRLGVGRTDIRFLGFPDGGLGELWRMHWLPSHPYTSPYTNESSPPAPDGVGYDGQDLTRVVGRELAEFRPSVVIMPHPYDAHLDHAHTSYFVTEALTSAQERGALPKGVTVLTYLVHYPAWPVTTAPDIDRLRPLSGVPDSAWVETDLSPAELEAKKGALAEYRTQLEVMGGFLRNFLCRNELYQRIDGRVLDRIASIH